MLGGGSAVLRVSSSVDMVGEGRSVLVWMVVMALLTATPCRALEARCPQSDGTPEATDSYCNCTRQIVRSGARISIICDFWNKEDVVLSSEVFPFLQSPAVMLYVQISNASSLRVTDGFMGAWQALPSAALAITDCGHVTLSPAPIPTHTYIPTFKTSAGVAVVGSYMEELPGMLLRGRHTAKLLIRRTTIDTIKTGILHQVRKLQYVVVEDSVVGVMEGPLSSSGRVELDPVPDPTWNGLLLSNVTINSLAPGAFNFSHQAEKGLSSGPKIEVRECVVGRVGSGAISVVGDVDVTIKANNFSRLSPQAFKIDVRNDLKFEENVATWADPRSLEQIVCHNLTSLEKNTVHLDSLPDTSSSLISFHESCGKPQLFTVVSPAQPQVMHVASVSTWVLLAVLLLILLAGVGSALQVWRNNNKRREFSRDDSFHFHNGFRSSHTRSLNQPEGNVKQDDAGEGVSNPLYEDMEYKSSL